MEKVKVESRAYGFSMSLQCKGKQLFEEDAKPLWKEYKDGDNSALVELIKGYYAMVYYIVYNKLGGVTKGVEDDCMQEGYISICKAVETYDDTKGVLLSSWVYNRVYWSIVRFIKNNTLVHIPDSKIKNYFNSSDFDLEGEVAYTSSLINTIDIGDVLEEDYSKEYQYSIEDEVLKEHFSLSLFQEVKKHLTEREYGVLIDWYVSDLTLDKIAKKRNLPRERIRQILTKVIVKLRRNKKFCEYLDVKGPIGGWYFKDIE